MTTPKQPVVETTSGVVRGLVHENTAVFLGIPYAQDPFGVNRLEAPRRVPNWDGVREAVEYAASAPQANRQFTLIPEPVIDGEGCLNLNVFTPGTGAARLPVLFWIHGGGFVAGSNASPWYRGERFCRDGIVVVSVNYRLGIEGFLALDGAPHNRAVLDWIAALTWVHENVAAFGGDPSRVTIAGQSAGGAACATLLTVPRARGLFRSAVLMSGVGLSAPSLQRAREFAATVADEIGAHPTIDDFRDVPPDKLVEIQDVVAKSRRDTGGPSRMAYAPVVDGDLVEASVYTAIKQGVASDIPVMVGTTAEEIDATTRVAADRIDEARVARRLRGLGLGDEAIAAYQRMHAEDPLWRVLGHALTDSTFRVPAVRFADARAETSAPTWMYDFRWRTAVRDMGAVHCLDVPFVFDVLDASGAREVTGPDAPQHLADEIHGAWVRFMREGDPGWPRYELESCRTQVFDEHSRVVTDPWADLRSVWVDGGSPA